MLRTKLRRKAKRIVVAEIMLPIILLFVLGITVVVCTFKLIRIGKIFSKEDTAEAKWIINLGVIMTYSIFDLTLVYFLRGGVRELNSTKCRIWVTLQVCVLCLFTIAVMKRCNSAAVGFHFFELLFLYIGVFIYKIHHITFVYNLADLIVLNKAPKNRNIFKRSRIIEIDTISDPIPEVLEELQLP